MTAHSWLDLYLTIHLISFLCVVLPSSAVGVGFYGNSEANDGVYQLTYSLYNANHTLGSISNLVSGNLRAIFCPLDPLISSSYGRRDGFNGLLHFPAVIYSWELFLC